MCGITGIAGNRVSHQDVPLIERMCAALRHRGPDDFGVHEERECILGQSRLSIIDLEGGHQPLCNEDGTVWITFNGEIYNYLEIRKDLIARGHCISTMTDTEVIVHLYEDYGIGLVEKLNGMFVFALWDAKRRTLFLVRDRLGIKPLYYHLKGDRLTFASEMKALLVDPETTLNIDREAIAEYLTLGYIPDPKTPFLQLRKLEGGSYIEFSGAQAQEKRYWRAPTCDRRITASIEDLCEEIRFLIEDAVRLQLRADVPVGLFASGGLDSTAIMWAAARREVSLEAFLVEFDHLAADTPFARAASAAMNMRLTEEHLSYETAGNLLPKLVWHLDEPLADPAIIPCYLVAKEAAKRVKVILNGTGGDEIFGGYPRYNLRGLLPGSFSLCLGSALSLASRANEGLHRFCSLLDYRRRYMRHLSVFPEQHARSALGLKGPGSVDRFVRGLFSESSRKDPAGSMMHVDMNLYLPGDLFMMLDKMTMAVSLEARVPLLDHRLVEFMAMIPGCVKMHGKELKWLLRRALRGSVPDQILDRPKQGFGPPISTWMQGPFGAAGRRLLARKDAGIWNVLQNDGLHSWSLPISRISKQEAGRLWSLLVLELWWKSFVNKQDLSDLGVEELAMGGG